jgi:hypothetical protein
MKAADGESHSKTRIERKTPKYLGSKRTRDRRTQHDRVLTNLHSEVFAGRGMATLMGISPMYSSFASDHQRIHSPHTMLARILGCTVRPTVSIRCVGKSRRWRSAIVIVAGLTLFAAVIAGWALQSRSAAVAPPQAPTLLGTLDVGAHTHQMQLHSSQPTTHFDRGSSQGSSPANHKLFKSAWRTPDRPRTWMVLAPQSVRSLWPVFMTAVPFQPAGARSGEPAAAFARENLLIQLCVARR